MPTTSSFGTRESPIDSESLWTNRLCTTSSASTAPLSGRIGGQLQPPERRDREQDSDTGHRDPDRGRGEFGQASERDRREPLHSHQPRRQQRERLARPLSRNGVQKRPLQTDGIRG